MAPGELTMIATTREIARFVSETSYDALPAEVRERAKALLLDLVGIAVRARHDAESTPAMLAAVSRLEILSPAGAGTRVVAIVPLGGGTRGR